MIGQEASSGRPTVLALIPGGRWVRGRSGFRMRHCGGTKVKDTEISSGGAIFCGEESLTRPVEGADVDDDKPSNPPSCSKKRRSGSRSPQSSRRTTSERGGGTCGAGRCEPMRGFVGEEGGRVGSSVGMELVERSRVAGYGHVVTGETEATIVLVFLCDLLVHIGWHPGRGGGDRSRKMGGDHSNPRELESFRRLGHLRGFHVVWNRLKMKIWLN